MKHKLSLLVLALVTGIAQATPTKVREVEGITEYSLPNGLQVLLAPDDSKPTTMVNVTYRVGSRQENYGETGMAHLLEHLLFKGSKAMAEPKAEFSKRGFKWNGSTWFDRTNYFAAFASTDDNLKTYLDWQADAMVNSFISRKDLDSEMTVVRNEMEMGESDPENVARKRAFSAMFQFHNYAKETIGARSDVENVDITHLQAFYRRYYQPDNATLIVSGKFDPAKTLAWIDQSFGKIPKPKRVLEQTYTKDPAQRGDTLSTVRGIGGNAISIAAYHVPAGATKDYAAVELLNDVLTSQPNGRLYKKLVVEDKLAAEVSPFSAPMAEPGFAMFVAKLAPGADQAKLNASLTSVLEGLRSNPIEPAELARAKTSWLNLWDKQFTSPERVGVVLSEYIAQGDWRLFFLTRDRIKALGLDDVQRVANQYLLPSNRTVVQYVPTEKLELAPAPAFVDVKAELASFKPQAGAAAIAKFDASPANIDKATQRSELPGGMKLALLSKPTRGEAVQGAMTMRVGTAETLKGLAATADLTGAMLKMGTKTLSRTQLRDALEAAKVQLNVQASATSLSVSWSTTREHAAEALVLVGDMVRNPSLDAAALDEVRAASMSRYEKLGGDPMALASQAAQTELNSVPRGDVRYKPSFAERQQDTQSVTHEAVRNFHQRFYGTSQASLAMVGDFDVASVKNAAAKAFSNWQAPVTPVRVPDPAVAKPGKQQMLLTPDKQNAMMFAYLGLPLSDDVSQRAALEVVDEILGGGGNSRIWNRLREKDGLSYGTGSGITFDPLDPNAGWFVYAIFAPQARPKIEAGLREEVSRLIADGVTLVEVEDAKKGLIAKASQRLAQDNQLAGMLASQAMLGRTMARTQKDLDAIAAVSQPQVIAALQGYLNLDDFQLVFAGDFKETK